MSIGQILSGLSDRYHLLSYGSRAAQPRQQTLRALMNWSYDLLSAGAQLLWTRASVFADSFELDAAEGVCAGGRIEALDVRDLLSELVDHSVLIRVDHGRRVRYRLLEAVREYVVDRLRDSGDLDAARRRHRDWYAGFVAGARDTLASGSQVECYLRLRAEHPNLRLAFDVCTTSPADARIGLLMVADLQHYWVMAGAFSEGRRWVRQLVEHAPTAPERIGALTVASKLAVLQGDSAESLTLLRQARSAVESTGERGWMADIAHTEGLAVLFWGEAEGSIGLFNDALVRHRAAGNDFGVMIALIQLATANSRVGDEVRAFALCAECLEISHRHDDRWCASMALWTQAMIRWNWGEHAQADALAKDALRIKESFGDRMGMAIAMDVIAWVAEANGNHVRAARLLGAVEAAFRSVGATSLFRHLAEPHAQCVERARRALGAESFDEAITAGRTLGLNEAVALALKRGLSTRAPSPVPRQDSELTSREHEIAELVTKGLSNREIAAALVISPRTAEKHVEKILTKLGLNSRTQIGVLIATENAAGEPPPNPPTQLAIGN